MEDGLRSVNTPKSLLVYVYGKKRVLGRRQNSYTSTIEACKTLFPSIPSGHSISLHTDDLDISFGDLVEISSESWIEIYAQLRTVTITTEEIRDVSISPSIAEAPALTNGMVTLCFSFGCGGETQVKAKVGAKLENVINAVFRQRGTFIIDEHGHQVWHFRFDGRRLDVTQTIEQLGLEDQDQIDVIRVVIGGKPVIYIFPPKTLQATVTLSLVPHWSLSAIYPVVPIKVGSPPVNEKVVWKVLAHPNGDLKDLTTGLDVAYLFWEARATPPPPQVPDSPPPSPQIGSNPEDRRTDFIPSDPMGVLDDKSAVLMPTEIITPYLDATLSVLGLHTEARTSFITYWLPSILKHKHIVLRFLPQDAYERVAPLNISPEPDIVTRIFMVFRGIKEHELGAWPISRTRAQESPLHWVSEVGVDVARIRDKELFRIIEWGGMEAVI